jgi:hypothetical protein
MKSLKLIGFNILITLILLEFGLFLATKMGLLRMDLPSYSIANITPFWMDMDPNFGVWRPANSQYRHLKSCFDITYRTNSHGMRDAERPLKTQGPRVVVLGDSFIEGYGVARQDRLTNILERRTGIPHLNFGTSGNFGLTQSLLLYKTLASRFDHDAVIISVLPDNDFSDDDPGKAETIFHDRYRPYLAGTYPNYELFYSNPNIIKTHLREYSKYVEVAFNEFSYTVRAYSYFKNYFKMRKRRNAHSGRGAMADGRPVRSEYFDFTSEEFDRMRYAIEQIVALAAPRPVLVISIPRRSDYRRAGSEPGKAPLTRRLEALSKTANYTYLDLLEYSRGRNDLDRLFHSCDPHWSPAGHAMAAAAVGEWDYYRNAAARTATSAIR